MASEQLGRTNVADEKAVDVEIKGKVPAMTSHFESLKAEAKPVAAGEIKHEQGQKKSPHQHESLGAKGGKVEKEGEHKMFDQSQERKPVGVKGSAVEKNVKFSLEETTDLRQQAQQNSMDAIRAAEEKYHLAKEKAESLGGRGGKVEKEGEHKVFDQLQERKAVGVKEGGAEKNVKPSLEETTNLRQQAQQNSMDAVRSAEEKYQLAKEKTASALQSAKETATEKFQKSGETVQPVREKVGSATQFAAEKARALKDTTLEKGLQAKDKLVETTVPAATQAKDYTYEKAVQAKDTVASAGGKTGDYVQEKAQIAKDATIETGKTTAGYAGKVATQAMDYTAVAGLGAAHYTAEKAAQATKLVSDTAANVAGYTGETVVAAKDKAADAGQSVIGYTSEKLAATKDAVVSGQESAAEYAARKKEEAKKHLEETKSSKPTGEGEATTGTEQKYEYEGGEEEYEFINPTAGNIQEHESESKTATGNLQEGVGGGVGGGNGGGVFQAIGETIVEIGQTTKDFLVGHDTHTYHDVEKKHYPQ